ncbi:MAG: hypothetical protein AB7Q37_00060 [Pyrinomonadaceae bacterium]
MVTIKIGNDELTFNSIAAVDENWVIQHVNARRHDTAPVCVRVTLNTDSVNIILSGGECVGSSGGGARPLTTEEDAAYDLWDKLGLNTQRIEGGKLVAFFKQVRRIAE